MDRTPLKANLKKYIKLGGRWRFVPVLKRNGVPVPGTIVIGGQQVRSARGTFYLDYYEHGRRVQKPVGTSAREAKDAWYRQCGGVPSPDEAEESEAGVTDMTVAAAFERFLEEARASKQASTHRAYASDLSWVSGRLEPSLVSAVCRRDILRVMARGREEGLNEKSINRRLIVALMALRNAGAEIRMKKGDWRKAVEPLVEIYERKQLTAFFAACTPREKLIFWTFLCSGFRKQELATLTWNRVNFEARTLTVEPHPEYGFSPKNHEKRSVPVPGALIRALASWQRKHPTARLVFPSPRHPTRPDYGGESPDSHHLELCKEIAWRARLNCRRCTTAQGGCATGPWCGHWTLHRWRDTFATNTLRSNVDIKSLQALLGHKNLATTEKYLKSLPLAGLRSKVEKSTMAALVRGE
jgi:integrase